MTALYKKNQFRKNRQALVDQDYEHKLSDKDKAWLNQFNQEYYLNNRSYDEPIHDSSYNKKNSNMNNARDRCLMTSFSYNQDSLQDFTLKPEKTRKDELRQLINTRGLESSITQLIAIAVDEVIDSQEHAEIKKVMLDYLVDSLELLRLQKNHIRNEKKLAKENSSL